MHVLVFYPLLNGLLICFVSEFWGDFRVQCIPALLYVELDEVVVRSTFLVADGPSCHVV